MAIIVIMKVSVADAKNNLPELIKAAEKGERQALGEDIPIVTPDRQFEAYKELKVIS